MATETYELSIQGINNASYRETVLHFSGVGVATGDTLAAAESLLNGWDATCSTAWLATLPASYQLVQIQARRVMPKSSATATKQFGVGTRPGTRGSNATGQQTCPSIFLVPAMGTKSGGRIFWPDVPQGDLNQSAYVAAWVTLINTALGLMITGFTNSAITWTLGVFSRKLGTFSNIASHSMSPVIGFQSKRRRPVGAVG